MNKGEKYNSTIKAVANEFEKIEGAILNRKKLKKRLKHIKKILEQLINFDTEKLDEGIINQLVDKIIVRGDKEFEWLINLSDIETTDLFNTAITEKIENRRQNTLEVRDKNYAIAFESMIAVDTAKEYREIYDKYLRKDKWDNIKYSGYVRQVKRTPLSSG